MKKIGILVLVALLGSATASFAAKGSGLAVGGEGALYFGDSGGLPINAMLLLHLPKFPIMFGLGVGSPANLGLTADYWAAHGALGGIFNWYAGVGAYLSVSSGSDTTLALGGRVPIGLQAWPIGQALEIFLEVAPAVGVTVVPTGFDLHLQAGIGARYWF